MIGGIDLYDCCITYRQITIIDMIYIPAENGGSVLFLKCYGFQPQTHGKVFQDYHAFCAPAIKITGKDHGAFMAEQDLRHFLQQNDLTLQSNCTVNRMNINHHQILVGVSQWIKGNQSSFRYTGQRFLYPECAGEKRFEP